MTQKEVQEKILATLKRWQKIEDEAVLSIGEFVATVQNPLPRSLSVLRILRSVTR
jgi:hypothetical protein